jgi:hypothetical protein
MDNLSHKLINYGNHGRYSFYEHNCEIRESLSAQVFKNAKIETRKVEEAEVKGLVLEHIASKFALTFSSAMFGVSQYFYCYNADLGNGVILKFSFKNPFTQDNDYKFLNLQVLYNPRRSKTDAFKKLKEFIKTVENAKDNHVVMIYFKFGKVNAKIAEIETETVPKERLLPIYERILGARPIAKTDYYMVKYEPKFLRDSHKRLWADLVSLQEKKESN